MLPLRRIRACTTAAAVTAVLPMASMRFIGSSGPGGTSKDSGARGRAEKLSGLFGKKRSTKLRKPESSPADIRTTEMIDPDFGSGVVGEEAPLQHGFVSRPGDRVLLHEAAEQDPEEGSDVVGQSAFGASPAALQRSRGRRVVFAELDEMEPVIGDESSSLAVRSNVPTEHELVDDNFAYFPAVGDDANTTDPFTGAFIDLEPKPEVAPPAGTELRDPEITRYRLEVEYRGDAFHGWTNAIRRTRRGPEGVTTSDVPDLAGGESGASGVSPISGLPLARVAVEDALAVALDLDHVKVVASTTPEKGVHVRRLTCHVDIPTDVVMQPRTVLQRAQAWLAKRELPVGILSFARCRADDDWSAFRAATRRVYCYRILNRIAPPVFDRGLHWHVDRHLDVARMQRAAQDYLTGTIDARAFSHPRLLQKVHKGEADSTAFVRTMDAVRVVRQEDEVHLWFAGRSFVRHQIRNMVGVLAYVGHGFWDDSELRTFVDPSKMPLGRSWKRSLRERPPTAPVHGLTLWDVEYPSHHVQSPPFVDRGPISDAAAKEREMAALAAELQ